MIAASRHTQERHVLIATPLMPPAVGGGGVYTVILSRELILRGYASKVTVLTEHFPEAAPVEREMDDRLTFLRLFPYRAGKPTKSWDRYLSYAWQNLQMLGLGRMCSEKGITALFVHGSFHNNPNLVGLAIKTVKRSGRVGLIADLRDPKLPKTRMHQLRPYQRIVCCSENIRARIEQFPDLYAKTRLIPVVVDVKRPTEEQKRSCLTRYRLHGSKYIFFGSGISREKGINRLVAVVSELRKRNPQLNLVVVGKRRDWSGLHESAASDGWLRYLGPVSHNDVLCLASASLADVNLSPVDSMPRASLESLAIGARVLLPPGVPEFDSMCPQSVAQSTNPEAIAEHVRAIMEGRIQCTYDLGNHTMDYVLPLYKHLLDELAIPKRQL